MSESMRNYCNLASDLSSLAEIGLPELDPKLRDVLDAFEVDNLQALVKFMRFECCIYGNDVNRWDYKTDFPEVIQKIVGALYGYNFIRSDFNQAFNNITRRYETDDTFLRDWLNINEFVDANYEGLSPFSRVEMDTLNSWIDDIISPVQRQLMSWVDWPREKLGEKDYRAARLSGYEIEIVNKAIDNLNEALTPKTVREILKSAIVST